MKTVMAAGLVVSGVLAGFVPVNKSSPTTGENSPRRTQHTEIVEGAPIALFPGDGPLGGGAIAVPRAKAEAFLSSASSEWPTLPRGSTVDQAWVRFADGLVAFEMDTGLTVLYEPDARSEREFVAAAEEMAAEEGSAWPFRVAPLRETQAEVADIHDATVVSEGHQVGPGPAAVSWIEGGNLVSLIGGPPADASGMPLSEVLAFAEAMGKGVPASL